MAQIPIDALLTIQASLNCFVGLNDDLLLPI